MAGKSDWRRYRDFVLRLEPGTEGTYRVSAQAPGGGVAHISVRLPFDEKDVQLFIHQLGHKRLVGKRGDAPQPFKRAVSFGRELFNTIISEDVLQLYSTARHDAQREDHGLRFQLRLSDTPQLADLPWEFLYDGDDFLVLNNDTPLVRYLDLKDSPRPMKVQPPLRILVTISDPEELPRLKVDDERAKIEDAVRKLQLRGALHVDFAPDARVATLHRTLRRARARGTPYHVWHYVGHGTFDPDTSASALLFCDRNHRAREISDLHLGPLFNGYPEIRLILLNACEAARPHPKDPFAGVAAGLVKRGVPAVIGMQFDISDEAAIRLSSEFYRALVDGLPVDAALTEARFAVFMMPNWVEWATPVLFMRAPDGRIFDLSESELPSEPSSVGTGTQPEDLQSALETLYTEGLASFFTKEWDSAITSFTRVAQLDPVYRDVVLKLEEARKQSQLARLYAQGSEAFESQAWLEAVESFQAILDLDAGYRDAADRLALAQRHSAISDLYQDAQQLHQAQQYQAVVNVIDHIRQLDPDFADPDGLLDLAREGLARQEREKKVSDLQIQALHRMDEQDWLAAKQILEQIRELEPDDAQRKALRVRVEQELDPSWQDDGAPSDFDLEDTGAADDHVEPKPQPRISIRLSAKPRELQTGESAKWTVTAENNGDTDLFGMTIMRGDTEAGKPLAKPFDLARGQKRSRTFTTSYDKPGRKSQTISARALDPDGDRVHAQARFKIKVREAPEPKLVPGFSITLSANPHKPKTLEDVKWTATVKNTGETDLFEVTVRRGQKQLGKPFDIAPGQKRRRTFTISYDKPGQKSRTVSAIAFDPDGETLQAKVSHKIKVQEAPELKPPDQTSLYLGKASLRKKPPPRKRPDLTRRRLVTQAELPKGSLLRPAGRDSLQTPAQSQELSDLMRRIRARQPAKHKEPDPLAEKILALLAKKASDYYDFHVDPDIPEKKRNNARSKCDLPYGERVLGLIDFTVWGSAKNALVFGEKAIYYHNGWLFGPGAESLRYSKFPKRKIKELFDDDGEPEEEVSLGKGQLIDLGASDVPASVLADILKRIKKFVR